MSANHSEITCHAAGERRQNYLNQIKCILDQMDDEPCSPPPPECDAGMKPLIRYPGYLDMKNPKFNRDFYVPLITNIQVKEIRPTSNYSQINESDERKEFYPVPSAMQGPQSPPWARPRYNSFELRASRRFYGCQCFRRNGIQDQCERSDCRGSPECLTDPAPTCLPSQTYPKPKSSIPMEKKYARVLAEHPPQTKNVCCCNPQQNLTPDELPSSYECFPCTSH